MSEPTAATKGRILVQDDEETIREIVGSMLTSSQYEWQAVESPKEAFDILSSGDHFDLVLCGLLETVEANFFQRVHRHFPDIPVLVLSACHDMRLLMSALQNGAYDYLLKPFEREQLLFHVRRALEYRRLRLENRAYARMVLKQGDSGAHQPSRRTGNKKNGRARNTKTHKHTRRIQ